MQNLINYQSNMITNILSSPLNVVDLKPAYSSKNLDKQKMLRALSLEHKELESIVYTMPVNSKHTESMVYILKMST